MAGSMFDLTGLPKRKKSSQACTFPRHLSAVGFFSKIASYFRSRLDTVQVSSTQSSYEIAKCKEIDAYKDVEDIHALPDIFHYWSHTYLRPVLLENNFSGIEDFFAKSLSANIPSEGKPVFLSVGSGYCDTEIKVAQSLIQRGIRSFKFECLELNAGLLRRGREKAANEGLSDFFIFTEADFNYWQPKLSYSGVMANHSLHHVVNLEGLFDNIKKALFDQQGLFVVNDMIGRNGHQRWPEALTIVSQVWDQLPQSYRYNHQLNRHEAEFINWDCSGEGFEGIRSQDILPLLVERFRFNFFHGFANVVCPFIDRSFGHNFDASADWDRSLIDKLHQIDEDGFKSGKLKPTQMLAVMSTTVVNDPIYTRDLGPVFAVRKP